MTTVFIAVAALIAATFFYVKWRSSSATQEPRGETGRQRFHAVAVRPGQHACENARMCEGTRYLSGEAPHLPLPECDAARCTCRFAHFSDRRTGDDRRSPFQRTINAGPVVYNAERRLQQTDRRHAPANDRLQFG